jgi:hypothetical protein
MIGNAVKIMRIETARKVKNRKHPAMSRVKDSF